MRMNYIRNRVGRESVKRVLRLLLKWPPLAEPKPGFSIVIGTPWDLRHLLSVNLKFVARTDLQDLHRIHVVFDRRPRDGAEAFIESIREQYPELPLTFRFYPPVSGRLVEWVNVSTFYNSLNTVLALQECETRYAILHDFDLYPLKPDYFTGIFDVMAERGLRFSGRELTFFDGLTERDAVIGTWSLAIDVEWLRSNYRPVDCFHTTIRTDDGRWMSLDPYSHVQMKTAERDTAGPISEYACHVRNLCSTYLRFTGGKRAKVAWRLHYLWYLESLADRPERLKQVTTAMEQATDGHLTIDNLDADFSSVHVGSAGVLRKELRLMDRSLHGEVRPEVDHFIDAFEAFLTRFGISDPTVNSDALATGETAGVSNSESSGNAAPVEDGSQPAHDRREHNQQRPTVSASIASDR